MATRIKTGALRGIEGLAVAVEVDVCRGLPGFHLVGLPGAEVKESRDRVLSALRNSALAPPAGKITVNLAPAGVRKAGASYDLAIAMGVLAAAGICDARHCGDRGEALYLGELSLFGELRPVRGLLAIVTSARERGERRVVVPATQVWEAELVTGMDVVGVSNLAEAVRWWRTGRRPSAATRAPTRASARTTPSPAVSWSRLADLHGQPLLRKAATVAAVGAHNLLLIGPPGTGKTRLARILGELQAPLNGDQGLEVTRIHGAAGILRQTDLVRRRPFRAPHHTITRAGLIGGGASLQPGEVTLAHRGILFLDELTEFSPAVLDVLREPLEEGAITVARGGGRATFPARFQLVAAMNPCRCGFLGSEVRPCRCRPAEQARYLGRLSGPLLDRFDLAVEVGPWHGRYLVASAESADEPTGEPFSGTTADWRRRPRPAVAAAARRLLADADRTATLPRHHADLEPAAARFLETLRTSLGLSLRGVERCLRVARTLAALDGSRLIGRNHVGEALEFRPENALARIG